jgi:hypothetical protein
MVVGHGPARCASRRPAWETPVRRCGANSEGPGGAGGCAGGWTGGGAGESGSMAAAVSAGDRGSGAVFPAGRNETPPPVTSRRRGPAPATAPYALAPSLSSAASYALILPAWLRCALLDVVGLKVDTGGGIETAYEKATARVIQASRHVDGYERCTCDRGMQMRKKGPGAKTSNHVTNTCISPRKLIKGGLNLIIAMSQHLESYYSKVDVRNPIITKRNILSPIITNFWRLPRSLF